MYKCLNIPKLEDQNFESINTILLRECM
uniref:Uncharacterized protein n=1 Tax=Rhizophora mucronata TaxID=61149 RepID=A0A2P2IW80_RHIMU